MANKPMFLFNFMGAVWSIFPNVKIEGKTNGSWVGFSHRSIHCGDGSVFVRYWWPKRKSESIKRAIFISLFSNSELKVYVFISAKFQNWARINTQTHNRIQLEQTIFSCTQDTCEFENSTHILVAGTSILT